MLGNSLYAKYLARDLEGWGIMTCDGLDGLIGELITRNGFIDPD